MNTKASPALKRPLEIKRGNVTVKIYTISGLKPRHLPASCGGGL
jgi:hypothetical protein